MEWIEELNFIINKDNNYKTRCWPRTRLFWKAAIKCAKDWVVVPSEKSLKVCPLILIMRYDSFSKQIIPEQSRIFILHLFILVMTDINSLLLIIVEKIRTGEFFAAKIVSALSIIQKYMALHLLYLNQLKLNSSVFRKKRQRIRSTWCSSGKAN